MCLGLFTINCNNVENICVYTQYCTHHESLIPKSYLQYQDTLWLKNPVHEICELKNGGTRNVYFSSYSLGSLEFKSIEIYKIS
jgi:hypothetical protein